MVETVVVVALRPLMILFNVDCVIPQAVGSLFKVMLFCRHKSKIRSLTASLTLILRSELKWVNYILLHIRLKN